ncbi:hypothetical protein [Isoptericola sp. G70]|uniref:hypothetical protein n=1 Tax=Isoptericola sp. G70 TaxID=3376633 RepID=UPI003A7FDBBE
MTTDDAASHPPPFTRPQPRTLDGSERFDGLDATVLDFWRFALSDLRMNNVRGYLGEFLVARALGATGNRVEWDSYDVLTPEGVRVEVKVRAHVQAWAQREARLGAFKVGQARPWDHSIGKYGEPGWNADVYVLCVHTALDHDSYDELDVAQWEFYVLARHVVVERAGREMSRAWLQEATGGPTPYAELAQAVNAAAR